MHVYGYSCKCMYILYRYIGYTCIYTDIIIVSVHSCTLFFQTFVFGSFNILQRNFFLGFSQDSLWTNLSRALVTFGCTCPTREIAAGKVGCLQYIHVWRVMHICMHTYIRAEHHTHTHTHTHTHKRNIDSQTEWLTDRKTERQRTQIESTHTNTRCCISFCDRSICFKNTMGNVRTGVWV
jgi:hypothetical protein